MARSMAGSSESSSVAVIVATDDVTTYFLRDCRGVTGKIVELGISAPPLLLSDKEIDLESGL